MTINLDELQTTLDQSWTGNAEAYVKSMSINTDREFGREEIVVMLELAIIPTQPDNNICKQNNEPF